ncbi:hypothetical protein EAF00_003239 [Botryotinia globosa]|nr:hypothetical protein EAF00_003239 [Botryotinia globosa]
MVLTKEERKKARRDAQGRTISGPINVIASTTLREGSSSYIRDTNDPTQQPPRTPNASLNYAGHSSTPVHSTGHNNPNLAPEGPPRSFPNNPHQINQAAARPAHYQQPAMYTSSTGQSSTTGGRPRSQDHTSSTQRNSGNQNSSRPSSSQSKPSSSQSKPSSSQSKPSSSQSKPSSSHSRNSSSDSRHSSSNSRASSLDRDPFELEKYRAQLK